MVGGFAVRPRGLRCHEPFGDEDGFDSAPDGKRRGGGDREHRAWRVRVYPGAGLGGQGRRESSGCAADDEQIGAELAGRRDDDTGRVARDQERLRAGATRPCDPSSVEQHLMCERVVELLGDRECRCQPSDPVLDWRDHVQHCQLRVERACEIRGDRGRAAGCFAVAGCKQHPRSLSGHARVVRRPRPGSARVAERQLGSVELRMSVRSRLKLGLSQAERRNVERGRATADDW